MTFFDKDLVGVALPHNNSVVIKVEVGNALLVDKGAFANILYANALKEMGLNKSHFKHNDATLVGFYGTSSKLARFIFLNTSLSCKVVPIKLFLVDSTILKRGCLVDFMHTR